MHLNHAPPCNWQVAWWDDWSLAFHPVTIVIDNATPTKSRLLPKEFFTGQKGKNRLELFHKFGCSIFVLEPWLQQGQKIPKWNQEPWYQMGVYLLGHSPLHAQTVPLILHLKSGLVSPQSHVVQNRKHNLELIRSCIIARSMPHAHNNGVKSRLCVTTTSICI